MAIEICKGTIQDYEEIIDFGNYVFYLRNGFNRLLPKVYQGHPETAAQHYLVKEHGRIVAMVGAFPQDFMAGEQRLHALGIGTVSVNPYHRGKGYMQALMRQAMEDGAANGIHFAYLGGHRQRYEYYGFTRTGFTMEIKFNADNIKAMADPGEGYTFAPLGQVDASVLRAVSAVHDARYFHAVRPSDRFAEQCLSFGGEPYAVFHRERPVGYLCAVPGERTISECYVENLGQLPQVTSAFYRAQQFGPGNIKVTVHPDQTQAMPGFTAVCETVRWNHSRNFAVLDYPRVLQAMLTLAGQQRRLPDAALTVAIEGEPCNLMISAKDGVGTVTSTDASADWHLTRLEALRRLFSLESMPAAHPLLPLPLFMLRADDV